VERVRPGPRRRRPGLQQARDAPAERGDREAHVDPIPMDEEEVHVLQDVGGLGLYGGPEARRQQDLEGSPRQPVPGLDGLVGVCDGRHADDPRPGGPDLSGQHVGQIHLDVDDLPPEVAGLPLGEIPRVAVPTAVQAAQVGVQGVVVLGEAGPGQPPRRLYLDYPHGGSALHLSAVASKLDTFRGLA